MSNEILATLGLTDTQMVDLVNELGGKEGILKFLEDRKLPIVQARTITERFPKWRMFRIGGVTKEVLLQRIEAGSSIAKWAKDLMKQPKFTTQETEENIETIILTPTDFGFKQMPTSRELFDQKRLFEWSVQNATRLPQGYVVELLPAEAGPHIRDQYNDQMKGEVIWVAMDPITDSGGGPGIFSIYWGIFGVQWLASVFVRPEEQWFAGTRIVFRLRKIV